MQISKYGFTLKNGFGITWRIGGHTSNGNGMKNFAITMTWKVGNGDSGMQSQLNPFPIVCPDSHWKGNIRALYCDNCKKMCVTNPRTTN